jgi:hypothetical protein
MKLQIQSGQFCQPESQPEIVSTPALARWEQFYPFYNHP